MNRQNIQKNKKGFVLLFSIILASIVLAIAVGIANISYKEILLTTSAKNGNDAFFSADVGVECALYLDKQLAFDTLPDGTVPPLPADCANLSIFSATPPASASRDTISFIVPRLGTATLGCAFVSVDKDSVANPQTLSIVSKGYNSGNAVDCPSGSNIVERELDANY